MIGRLDMFEQLAELMGKWADQDASTEMVAKVLSVALVGVSMGEDRPQRAIDQACRAMMITVGQYLAAGFDRDSAARSFALILEDLDRRPR